ncbi:aspartyl/asparaginyl beta-hydroxylase domain-containing protein [Denitrobaculum tricleocarpae]|uniref:Aspartyl/asparaginyl beta-hydroxylase domain-containing protein n=1 Tax=Denitrobaculum tricleocarpae TaxID=2591009 RepID=A0A545TFY2_9PROT|nr:aspartyl/asparaginyl beta-hydroxylase domain-containing protein [Denitrobaculum tricleocarpae]TQV76130.1 aspartyl/asparaginyl beta-hydroxylase domain-containing protein [Denitrobaculum tricleocarpae]
MKISSNSIERDAAVMKDWLAQPPDTRSVANFLPGPGIQKLDLRFDIAKLRAALNEALQRTAFKGDLDKGFGAFSLTRRPGVEVETSNDLSGRFYTRVDESYEEVSREDIVDEHAFSEFVPAFKGSYFEFLHQELVKRFPIGRMRVLSKGTYNCNSWHRDPEPRLHIPIITNPGALFIVNHHVTHLPADGSVYFTDTRGYHTALNGGESQRVHVVAALPT